MTRDEIINLLSVAAAYDKRTIGEADVAAYTDAADRGRWSYEQAADAIKAHYAESSEWLMPAHVTGRIRAERSTPPASQAALPRAGTADDEHVRRTVAWLSRQLDANRSRSGDRRDALRITCPRCGADPGRSCVQTRPDGQRRAGNLPIDVPHPHRRKAAEDR